MSGLFKFLGLLVCAAAVVVGVNYTAASIFEPIYPDQPAYAIEGAQGWGANQLAAAQVGWPTSGLNPGRRATLRGHMLALPQGETEMAKADTDASAESATEQQPKAVPSLPELLAAADADKGKKVARKCTTCHTFEEGGKNKVGPNLWNIVGSKPAHAAGFSFSGAITGLSDPWSFENLDAFIQNPKGYAKGTKMAYGGIKKAADRADLLAYMRTMASSPVPLPTADASQ